MRAVILASLALSSFEREDFGRVAARSEISVEREVGPTSSTAFHDLVTQKLKNRDPAIDVYFLDVVWRAEFAAAGCAQALDERFPAAERADTLRWTLRPFPTGRGAGNGVTPCAS